MKRAASVQSHNDHVNSRGQEVAAFDRSINSSWTSHLSSANITSFHSIADAIRTSASRPSKSLTAMGAVWNRYGPWAVSLSVFVLFSTIVLVCCILLHRIRQARFAAQAAPTGIVPVAVNGAPQNNTPNAMAMNNATSCVTYPPPVVAMPA
ncbi:hypothetical protein DOTSEDRAFT_70779 [Dothistroma septosporum NZE10]|uniref:Transmembrane protein n=1 Tax=Dothistroma septosporum (strain NZE10 / CBS 128990) TaxID=675120 RepID=N1PN59_DOTSN|nr:hypothetical protein DOTSEDRAFT_70779 [Dothistroma septosporum NZE10]